MRRRFTFPALLLVSILLFNHFMVYAKVQVPSAPASLTYTGLLSNEVTLKWGAVTNATGYKVYRAKTYDSNYSLFATVSTNSYRNTALTSGTKYWYYVKAYNSAGASASSKHISVTTPSNTNTITQKKVLGYATYYYSGDSSSYNSMVSNTSTIDEIATHTYITDGYGNISGLVPTSQISYANSNNIKPLVMVSNNFDGEIAKVLLENPTNRTALINHILTAIQTYGYKGVNVDLEGVYYYDRSYLTAFMNELYSKLNAQGLSVTMAVPAKLSDNLTDGWSGAFDFAALSNYCDQMIVMTYDEHYPGGTPGPIASIGWVENVIKYTVSVVPKGKVLLGAPAYGYDWSSNGTKAYGIAAANSLATSNNTTVKWDTVSQAPYFNYTDSQGIYHNVWFENAQSLNYKLDLVNSYSLSGIAIWRLGFEDSNYWASIKTKFNR